MLSKSRCALIVCVCSATLADGNAQTTSNPVQGSAPIAHWSLLLEDVVQVTRVGGGTPRLEYVTGNPTNGLAYVIDQHGAIFSFDPKANNPTASLVVDLNASVGNLRNGGESGVRGMAFHPDFDNAGTGGFRKMYTSLSRSASAPPVGSPNDFNSPRSTDHYTVLGEWTLNSDGSVMLDSYRELLRVAQPFSNHNAGHIEFNPNAQPGDNDYGNLYMGVGDGGSSNGPDDLSQRLAFIHGKVIRIDPVAAGEDPYSIPNDNPFADLTNVVKETWAYGLRNPHKFAWDQLTGEMYVSDIGQNTIEEINLGRAGANYGWNDREGTFSVGPGNNVTILPADHASDSLTYPVAQYDHNGTNGVTTSSAAVVGGPVYRGQEVPELTGMYFFADFASNPGPIFAADVDDLIERDDFQNFDQLDNGRLAPFVEVEIRDDGVDKDFRQFLRDANNSSGISRTNTRWGIGPNGEFFLLNKQDGMVRRIVGVAGLAQGDANRDGTVDADDRHRWETAYGLAGDWSDANFDAGPITDGDDFVLWQRNAGQPATRSVPEPAGLTSVAWLMGWMASGRRRRNRAPSCKGLIGDARRPDDQRFASGLDTNAS